MKWQNSLLLRHNFTLIEMLVVIAIIAILASMLTPALRRSMESANSILCQSNLKQLANAGTMYSDDNNSFNVPSVYNSASAWEVRIQRYLDLDVTDLLYLNYDPDVVRKLKGTAFDCPTVPGPMASLTTSTDNFWYNNYGIGDLPSLYFSYIASGGVGDRTAAFKVNRLRKTSATVMFGETTYDNSGNVVAVAKWGNYHYTVGPYSPTMIPGDFASSTYRTKFIDWERHLGRSNWVMYDGHVVSVEPVEYWIFETKKSKVGTYLGMGFPD